MFKVRDQTSYIRGQAPSGAVALVSVIVIMSVLVSVGIAVSFLGINETVLSGIFQDGETAFSIADACTEEGLFRLKDNQTYTGSSFSLDGGSCNVSVTNITGNTYRIDGVGVYKDHTRIIVANVTIRSNGQSNSITAIINSWKEAE